MNNARNRVTLLDIAKALGISKATVSLALNGNELVAKKTRQQVLEKMEELGYVYNRGAAGLSTGETRTVGLAVHDITNPYFSKVCASIESVLSMNKRMSFLCNTAESLARQKQFINALIEYNSDGLIICPAVGTKVEDLDALVKSKIPVVFIARNVENPNFDFVGNDDELALKLATDHLIELGHRRIAMLGGGKLTTVGQGRREGFLRAMREANLVVDQELLIDCDTDSVGGSEAVKLAMASSAPPTAIACFNDRIALGAMSELYELGMKPGRDIAVIGCDGIGEGGRAYARLSTVNVQKTLMGKTAAEILMNRLEDPQRELQHVVLEPSLIIRSSSGG